MRRNQFSESNSVHLLGSDKKKKPKVWLGEGERRRRLLSPQIEPSTETVSAAEGLSPHLRFPPNRPPLTLQGRRQEDQRTKVQIVVDSPQTTSFGRGEEREEGQGTNPNQKHSLSGGDGREEEEEESGAGGVPRTKTPSRLPVSSARKSPSSRVFTHPSCRSHSSPHLTSPHLTSPHLTSPHSLGGLFSSDSDGIACPPFFLHTKPGCPALA